MREVLSRREEIYRLQLYKRDLIDSGASHLDVRELTEEIDDRLDAFVCQVPVSLELAHHIAREAIKRRKRVTGQDTCEIPIITQDMLDAA